MSRKDARNVRSDTKDLQKSARQDVGDEEDIETFEEDFEGRELKHIDRFVKRIHNGAGKIEKAMTKLGSATHNGGSAIEAAKNLYQEKYGLPLPTLGGTGEPETAVAPVTPAWKSSFPKCQGGINKIGCRSNAIGKVQAALDVIDVDGKFGPQTQKLLATKAPEFSKQFTDTDLPAVLNKIKGVPVRPKAPLVKPNPGRDKVDAGFIDRPGLKGKTPKDTLKTADARATQANEGGYKNMAQGFVNESISQKERKRQNKEDRLNIKFNRQ